MPVMKPSLCIATVICLFATFSTAYAQTTPEQLKPFENLIGGIWKAEGRWGNGQPFKSEKQFHWGPGRRIVRVATKGFTDQAATVYGERNQGIRILTAEGSLLMYEFDVFGGITKGEISTDGANIYYDYDYGGTMIRDAWQFIDQNTYRYIVGVWKEGRWEAKYLETEFRRE